MKFSPPHAFTGSFNMQGTTYRVAGQVDAEVELPDKWQCKTACLVCSDRVNLQAQPQAPFIGTMAPGRDKEGFAVLNMQMANGAVIICKLSEGATPVGQPLSGIATWVTN